MSDEVATRPKAGIGVVLTVLCAAAIGLTAGRWSHSVDIGSTAGAPRLLAAAGDRAVAALQIDLNRATAAELSLLPGVGETIAQRIVEHREAHGEFGSVEALDDVKGVGPAIIERIRGVAIVEESE